MMPRLAAAVGSLCAVRLRICHGGDPPLGDRGRVGLRWFKFRASGAHAVQ